MRRHTLPDAFVFMLMIFLPLTSACAAGVKVGLIDTKRVMMESRAARDARGIFLKDLEAKRAVFNAGQEKVRSMEEELRKAWKDLSTDDRKERAEELSKEKKELARLRTDLEEELKKTDAELTQKIMKEIRETVDTYRKENKYTIILDKTSVVAADEGIDITNDIIRIYDAGQK